MKAISAGGRVSPVSDLLPRALPAFYVLAPDYIPLLLKPVLNMTLSWPMDYAIHDIGKRKFQMSCLGLVLLFSWSFIAPRDFCILTRYKLIEKQITLTQLALPMTTSIPSHYNRQALCFGLFTHTRRFPVILSGQSPSCQHYTDMPITSYGTVNTHLKNVRLSTTTRRRPTKP